MIIRESAFVQVEGYTNVPDIGAQAESRNLAPASDVEARQLP
jgi:hypothetical protein